MRTFLSIQINMKISDGQPVYSNITNKEISNGKPVLAKDQQEVKNCNDNYHALFEQATDAIMVTDFNGNFIDVNSSLCAMFGYTKEDLLTLNVKALLDPENLKIQPLRFDLLAAGENVCNERKMIHKNGRVIYVEANAKKFVDNRILVIARDITERKRWIWYYKNLKPISRVFLILLIRSTC